MALEGQNQHFPVGEERSEQPLKLFVGQVPKDMDEDQLRPLFEQAGAIAHIMVIRDRQTDAHRGCAFLTYQTREAGERAVEKFHNKVKLPNAHNPVQVRPADSQMGDDRMGPNARVAPVDRENKLFVGMLPHDADDMTLTEVFSRFGEITEIYCMRNPDGTPKGCAFVKFSTRSAAIAAIEALHEKCTMDGATRALVVKFADVKKPHTAKGGWLGLGLGLMPDGGRGASPSAAGMNGGGIRNPAGYWHATGPTGVGGPRDAMYGGGAMKGREVYPQANPYPYQPGYPAYSAYDYHPHHAPVQRHAHGHGQGGYSGGYSQGGGASYNPQFGGPGGERSLSPSSIDRSQAAPFSSPQGGPMSRDSSSRDHGRGDGSRDQGGGTRPQEGPPGANLFIYHLPNDLTDADLATAFAPFGHVVSAKVFLDRRTGESKGFGFVSYNHPSEAEVAISKMNGFQIGSKRLKVQHKKADHSDREQDGPRYSGHHGSQSREMMQHLQHTAPLHGGSGRLGMGYSSSASHLSSGPPPSSPEMRGYQSHPGESGVLYTGGGDTRTIYAGPIPSSSYDGHDGHDSYRANVKPMGHSSGVVDVGGGDGNNSGPSVGGLYHSDEGGH